MSLGSLYAQTNTPLALTMSDALFQAPTAYTPKQALFIKSLYSNYSGDNIKSLSFFDHCLNMDSRSLLAYRDKLNDVIIMLDRNPQLGHQSRELPDTHRLYFAGSHVIVYRTRQDATEVMRTCISAGAPRGMYRAMEAEQCGKSIVS